MPNIKSLLKATGNKDGTIVGLDGVMTDPVFDPYLSGSYSLNGLLGGSIWSGISANKITAFAGEQGVGKTYFLLEAAKEFLETYPEGVFAYFDTEAATTAEMLADRVGHIDRIMVIPVVTVQAIATQLSSLLTEWKKERKNNPKARLFVGLDSLGNLSTEKEITDIEAGTGTKDMTRAQLLKGTFRALTVKFAMAQVPLVFTNHTYQGMDPFSRKTMSGGGGPLFSASTIIFLTKKKISEGTGVKAIKTGNIINMTLFKGRLTKEGSKAQTRLFFDSGLDPYYGLLPIAKKHKVWPVSGGQCVIDGEKVAGAEIERNPEKYFTSDVLKLVDAACQKEFLYGSSQGEAEEVFEEESDD